MPSTLDNLPVELIYEIQLNALSESLPLTNRRTYEIFRSAHHTYRTDYIVGRYLRQQSQKTSVPARDGKNGLVSYALRYALCSKDVLDSLLARAANSPSLQVFIEKHPRIPRRLFAGLQPRAAWERTLLPSDEPLPFLRYLSNIPHLKVQFNICGGFPLCLATHAYHIPLMKFLLSKGASPKDKDAVAVRVAIFKQDLSLVRLLIERTEEAEEVTDKTLAGHGKDKVKGTNKNKRRRLEDRMEVTTDLLKMAVEADARDIVEYFMDKGARPDMSTLKLMVKRGIA